MKIASLLLFVPLLVAQNEASPVTYSEPAPVTAKAGAVVRVTLPVTVAAGYHANSNKPADQFLIPLRLTWNSGTLQPGAIVFPKAQILKLGFSSKPVSVFTGQFEIVTRFQVPRDLPAGTVTVTGKLHYQACDDHSCLTPKTIEVSAPVVIGK